MTNEEQLLIAIKADTTNLMSGLKGASTGITNFKDKIAGIGKTATIAGAAVAAAVVKTFKDFTDYETKLVDMAKVTGESFESIEEKISGIDPILGSSTELMAGYYQVISAGVKDPVEALDTLTVAFQTGKAAHLEQAEVVKGITKMMAGFEGVIGSASEAADLMFSIEKEGQTTVAELVPVIGGLAKMSSDLAVLPEEMAAAIAVTTKTAGSTAEAATQVQAIYSGLMKPTEDMTEAFTAIGEKMRGVGEGYKDANEMIADLGFVDTMKALREHMEETDVSAGKLFGRKEAMIGFSAIGAEGFKTLDETIVSVKEGVGGAEEAFENWSESGAASIDEIKNTFLNFSADIGKQLAPMIKELLGSITEVIKKVSEWAKANPELFESLIKGAAIIGGIAAVGGPIMMAVGAISAILSPIGLVVIAVAGLATAWATNFGGIRDITKSVFEFIKGVFDKLVNFISKSFERLKKIIDYIKKAVAGIGKVATEGITVGVDTKEGYGIGGTSVPSHQEGISYVPKTGLALLHEGEGVLNKAENKAYQAGTNSYSPTINITIEGDADESKVRRIIEKALEESTRQFNRTGNVLIPGMA